jgi:hypothetical protein
MLWNSQGLYKKKINTILAREDCQVEDLLSENETLSECKT